MATQVTAPGEVITFEANGDLSASLYNVVYQTSTAHRVALLTTAASRQAIPLGILQNKPNAAGDPANIKTRGLCIARAGAAVTAGRALTVDASGSVIHQDSAGQHCVGIARTGAGAAGEQIAMLWNLVTMTSSF